MAISIDWSLLQPVDIGGQFTQGFERGKQQARERAVEGALSDLMPAMVGGGALDPAKKQHALGALAMYAPDRFAAYSKFEAAQREERVKQQALERQTALGELFTKDPQGAITEATAAGDVDLAKQFQALDETQRKAVAARYQSAAPIAYQVAKMPYEQRKAAIQTQAPALLAGGWTPEQIAGFDPTDEALGGIVSSALSVEKLMERDKITWHQQGEQPSFATDSMGRPVGSQNPYAGGGMAAAAPTNVPAAAGAVASTLSTSLPAPVVAGFLGNFHAEGGYGGAKGDGGTAHGIAQWRGDRLDNFQRVIGKAPTEATPDEQAKFVLWEMNNPEQAGMTVQQRDAIMAAKTPGEAAALIDQYYERSSGEHRQKRVAAAERMSGAGGGKTDSAAAIRQQAQEAIAAGADPAKVRQRAAEMGVSL